MVVYIKVQLVVVYVECIYRSGVCKCIYRSDLCRGIRKGSVYKGTVSSGLCRGIYRSGVCKCIYIRVVYIAVPFSSIVGGERIWSVAPSLGQMSRLLLLSYRWLSHFLLSLNQKSCKCLVTLLTNI